MNRIPLVDGVKGPTFQMRCDRFTNNTIVSLGLEAAGSGRDLDQRSATTMTSTIVFEPFDRRRERVEHQLKHILIGKRD